jgi:hypothetical protein
MTYAARLQKSIKVEKFYVVGEVVLRKFAQLFVIILFIAEIFARVWIGWFEFSIIITFGIKKVMLMCVKESESPLGDLRNPII